MEAVLTGRSDTPQQTLRTLLLWLVCGLSTLIIVYVAGRTAESLQIDGARQVGEVRIERYRQLLTAELSRFQSLPGIVRLNDDVIQLLEAPNDRSMRASVNRFLKAINREAGASAIYLVDRSGHVVAASNWDEPVSFVGLDLSYRPYIQEALRAGRAEFYGVGTASGVAGYYLSRGIEVAGDRLGVVVIKVAVDKVDNPWGPGAEPTIVVDEFDVVILTSNPAWRYRTLHALPADAMATVAATRKYADVPLRPLGLTVQRELEPAVAIVTVPDLETGEPQNFLAHTASLDRSGWRMIVLSPLDSVNLLTGAAQTVAALTCGLLMVVGLYVAARRRAYRLEKAARDMLTAANVELERKVAERTQDLVRINEQLRREIGERERAEVVLREAQDGLVHAGKLAVIGQMAAGMAHELNQPVAALRTLADNTLLFLDRQRPDAVRSNLQMMGQIVSRMGGITGQLKSFARRSSGDFGAVPVAACLDHALVLVGTRADRQGVEITRSAGEPPLMVTVDAGRLEQVFVNLLGNALDALDGQTGGRVVVDVSLSKGGGDAKERVAIAIRDNGPGIPDAVLSRLFEPFFTTKPAGVGLGLGLTISDTILRQFGGSLVARNIPGGGAEFVVLLAPAPAGHRDG